MPLQEMCKHSNVDKRMSSYGHLTKAKNKFLDWLIF